MKYYFILQNKKLVDAPQIINWYQQFGVETIGMGKYHKIPNRTVLRIKHNPNVYFPEILFSPCFMISKKIVDILKLYEPTMRYKEIILLDMQSEKVELYYLPYLDEINCLVKEKTVFGNFRGVIEKATCFGEEIGDTSMFYIEHNNMKYYVARHDFLESLIRRNAILDIQEIDIV